MIKQSFLTVCFFAISLSIFSQNKESDTINQIDSLGRKQAYWVKYHEEGQKKYEGFFKDDYPQGLFKYYYPDGKLRAESVFYNKGKINKATTYHKNGKKLAHGLYIETKKDSIWNYFNEEEILIKQEVYKMGIKEGIWKTFYPDGSLDEEITWQNDIRHGPWKQYYSDGTLKLKANYVDGFLEGKCIIFDPEGVKYIQGKYKKSQKNGPWVYFDENGLQTKRDTYAEDFLIREEIFLMKDKILKPFNIHKIAYAFKTNGKVFIRFYNGETFEVEVGINELAEILGIYNFVKANNTFIVNFRAVISIDQNNDAGLILEVNPSSEIPVVVDEEFKDPFIPFIKRNLD